MNAARLPPYDLRVSALPSEAIMSEYAAPSTEATLPTIGN